MTSKERTLSRSPLTPQIREAVPVVAMSERFDLPDPLPFKFSPSHKKLFQAIQQDGGRGRARIAFQELTTGRRPIDKSWLLFALGIEAHAQSANINYRQEWRTWDDAWEGFTGVAKTLGLLARKMRNHLKSIENKMPPFAALTSSRPGAGDVFSSLNMKMQYLENIPADLEARAELIGSLARLNSFWKGTRSAPLAPTPRDVEIQAMQGLLRFAKENTGRYHYEKIAALVNVGRRLNNQKEETAEMIRKMLDSPSIKRARLH